MAKFSIGDASVDISATCDCGREPHVHVEVEAIQAAPRVIPLMPVPKCSSCQYWEDGAPMEFVQGQKPTGRWGYCHLISTKDYDPVNAEALAFVDTESAGEHAQQLYVHEDFGCVQFKPTITGDPAA